MFWVWLVTVYLILYVALLTSGFGVQLAVFMFSLSPVFIVWMVVRVLRDDYQTDKTFDKYFYEDMDWKKGE